MPLSTEVGLGLGHIVLDGIPKSPHFSAYVYCGQVAGWIKIPLGTKAGVGPGDIVLDENPAGPKKKGTDPRFLAHVCCGQIVGLIKRPLGREVGLGSGDFVLDGTQPPKMGHSPHFSVHIYCGQIAGWINIPLGKEVGLGPGYVVLDGDPLSPKKGHSPPIFSPCLLWPNGCPSELLLSTCFTGRMLLLSPNQQCQSTEGKAFC